MKSYRLKVASVADQGFAALPKTFAVASILIHHGFDYTMKLDYLWAGWISKLWHMMDVVEDLVRYTHLMFIDCADIVALTGPDEIMERYFAFGHPWIFNAEEFIWSPDSFQSEDYPTPDVKYRYLNAGASIGEIGHMREWLLGTWGRPSYIPGGDQDWLAGRFLDGYPDAIMLDTNCDLFQCMCGSQVEPDPYVVLSLGKAYNRITDTYPLILHFNGGTDVCDSERKPLWEAYLRKPQSQDLGLRQPPG